MNPGNLWTETALAVVAMGWIHRHIPNRACKRDHTLAQEMLVQLRHMNNNVQYEPNDAFRPHVLVQLASVGIENGKKFNLDARMKEIVTEAAVVGKATARALLFKYPGQDISYNPGSAWFKGFAG